MATLTTSWASYDSSSVTKSGQTITFYLEAKYTTQSQANNTTKIQTRLRSTVNGQISGSGYKYTCSYCTTRSGSGVWTFDNEVIISSPETTITHNSDGTKSITLKATAKNTYWSIDKSLSATVTIPKIDRLAIITNASDFNDEENQTITFTNPANFTIKPFINFYDKNNTLVYQLTRNESITSPYVWEITSQERTAIRTACNTQQTYKANVGVDTYSGSTKLGYTFLSKTFTIINANPTLSVIKEEINADVITLLGTSASSVVKNVSRVQLVAVTDGVKEATISKVTFTDTNTYIEDTTLPYTKTIIPVTGDFTVVSQDSRGNTTTSQNTSTLIDYEPVSVGALNAKRVNPTSSNIKLKVDIKYVQVNFGNTANVPTIKWKVGEEGAETALTSDDYTIDTENKKIIVDTTIQNAILYNQNGSLIVTANDLLTTANNSIMITKGIPTFDAGEADFKVNGDLYVADSDGNNKYNIGDLVLAQTNCIRARMSSNYTMANNTEVQTLPINTDVASCGDGRLTLASNGVKIGAGVHHVLVSGQIYWYTNVLTTNDSIGHIYHNDSPVVLHNTRYADNYEHMALVTALVEVQENDVITLRVKNVVAKQTLIQGTMDNSTFLNVQVID